MAPREPAPPGGLSCHLQPQGQVGVSRALPQLFSMSPLFLSHFSPGSSDKIDKRNDTMKRRGSSNRGRRNFETRKKKNPPAQPSPTEKQKVNVVSHSAPLSSSPGTPRPPAAPRGSESPRKRPRRSCAPAAKQKATCKADSAQQRTERKKGCSRTSFLPHPILAFWGRNFIPKQTNQHRPKGPVPHPCPSWGNPTLSWGSERH